MKAALKFIMTAVGLLLIGLFIVVALLLTRFEGVLRDGLTYQAGRILQSEVRLESARFDWSERAFVLKGVTVFNPEGFTDRDAIRIEAFTVKPDPLTLFSKNPTIAHVGLRGTEVHLQISAEQQNNLGTLVRHVDGWVAKQEAGHKTTWGRQVRLREIRGGAVNGHVEKLLPPTSTVPLEVAPFNVSVGDGEHVSSGAGILLKTLNTLAEEIRQVDGLDAVLKDTLILPEVEVAE